MTITTSPGSKGSLHAVVIGVSEYEHRPDLTTSGPAMSAARFAEWLRTEFRHPELALGELRVLLSPTEAERESAERAAGRIDGRAARDPVESELAEWALRCNGDERDAGLLYLAGHGTSMVAAGGYLLLEDFGAPGAVLARALHIDSVRDAMEVRRAHANFFFVDACQETLPEQLETAEPQAVRPVDMIQGAPRTRKFYRAIYGAAPEQEAWTLPEAEASEYGTVFSKSLLRALETSADYDDDGRFSVTVSRLIVETARNVQREGDELRARYGRDIQGTSQASGIGGDRAFHVPERVPVRLEIELVPGGAAATAEAALYRFSQPRRTVFQENVALHPHPAVITVDSGKYQLQLKGQPPPAGFDQIDERVVLPAAPRWEVPIEYLID